MQLRLHDEFPSGHFYLSWFDADEGDFGATLGENHADGSGDAPTDRGDWEHWIACKTVREMFPDAPADSRGWHWHSRSGAQRVFAAIKQAMNQERPLPEWAKTALQEGWKPPKNWKA